MKGRAFAAVVLSALLLLSGLGIGGWWLLWQRGPLQLAHQPLTMPRAARFVPASASFSLYLFSDGQRPVDYARAVAPARQRRPAGEAIARLRDGAFAAAGLDYKDELAGWLGGDIAMALFEDPVAAAMGAPEQPARGWLLALASRDDDGARRFLQRFWQTRSLAGTDLQVSRYRGMGLISGRGALLGSQPEPLATALVDDDLVLIASGRNLLERALDASQIDELNQAGQPQLRQGVASFASGAALAVASPQALQSWLGLPALEVSPAAPAAAAGPASADSASQAPVAVPQVSGPGPAASAAAGRGASSPVRSSAGRPASQDARDDSAAAAAAGSSPAVNAPPPGADRKAPELAAPPVPSATAASRDPSAAAARAAERASAPTAAVPDGAAGAGGSAASPLGSAPPQATADPAIPAAPAGPGGMATPPRATAPSEAPPEAPPEAGSAAVPSASRAGADAGMVAGPAEPPVSNRDATAAPPDREPSSPDAGVPNRPLEPAEQLAAHRRWSASTDRSSSASRPLRGPWAVQPAHALVMADARQPSQTAAARQPSADTAMLLAVLQPQGRQLELRARLLLPRAPRLPAAQAELNEALLASLRGSPSSLALIQDPAAFGQQPLLRPLLERSLGLRPSAAAERQGPLPPLLAQSIHGPLLASQSAQGWQLASRAGDPAAADLEPLLRQAGLLEAPLELDGHSLRVWTHLSLPAGSGRRDRSGGDALLAPLAGWSEQRQEVAWWGQTLAALEAPADSRPLTALRRGLRELGLPQAPLQLSLDADAARALLRSWQPWRLLSALAGGGLDGPVHGLALAVESPPELSALELRARLHLGA